MKTHYIKCPNCNKGKIRISVHSSTQNYFDFDIYSCSKCNHDLIGTEIEQLFEPVTNKFLYENK